MSCSLGKAGKHPFQRAEYPGSDTHWTYPGNAVGVGGPGGCHERVPHLREFQVSTLLACVGYVLNQLQGYAVPVTSDLLHPPYFSYSGPDPASSPNLNSYQGEWAFKLRAPIWVVRQLLLYITNRRKRVCRSGRCSPCLYNNGWAFLAHRLSHMVVNIGIPSEKY